MTIDENHLREQTVLSSLSRAEEAPSAEDAERRFVYLSDIGLVSHFNYRMARIAASSLLVVLFFAAVFVSTVEAGAPLACSALFGCHNLL